MGKLGFLFIIEDVNTVKLTYLFEKIKTKNFVVFIDSQFLAGSRIISFESKFSYQDSSFYYLDKNYNLQEYLVFETKDFIKSKISLSDINIINLEQGLCWVDIKNYHLLRQLLFINSGDLKDEILKRLPKLLEIFNDKLLNKR